MERIDSARQAVLESLGVWIDRIVLVATIPRTTSGKINRQEARAALENLSGNENERAG